MKKISLFLAVLALFAALTVTVYGQEPEMTKEEAIITEARRVYYYSLSSAGRKSFAGFCGLMTSHQLYHMDVNKSVIANDGNRQFDYYKNMKVTSGGYYITPYPATEYTLKDALNAITLDGRKDAYNLLVGFQWTNTAAGHRYGHACVINAIVDGTVYFVESFYTSIGGREGNVLKCSIEEFAAFFDDWTVFEGIIDFGTGQYADACEIYDTDLLARTRFETTVRSQPCLVGENGCVTLRTADAGELLQVSGVCIDPETDMQYYRVEDGETTGYISAGAASVTQSMADSLTASAINIPAYVKTGEALSLSGKVIAEDVPAGGAEIVVTDAENKVVLRQRENQESYELSLSLLNGKLAGEILPSGIYKVQLYATAACKYVNGGTLETKPAQKLLYQQLVLIGQRPIQSLESWEYMLTQDAPADDGWVRKDGAWYCYEAGKPCAGWQQKLGVVYYLEETGKAASGWTEVDGVSWYFSPTGALCTGWLTTPEGKIYLQEAGGGTIGWQTIDGGKYFFDDSMLLVTQGVMTDGKTRYEIQPDGRAVKLKEE